MKKGVKYKLHDRYVCDIDRGKDARKNGRGCGMKTAKTKKLPKSISPRIDIMCGEGSADGSLEDLRFRRDIAVKDGDMKLAMACAIAIDKKRGLYK